MEKIKILLLIFLSLYVFTANSKNGIYEVTEFGAVGDGETLCTEAMQKAIDKCAADGGGKVIVPPGQYITGSMFLKSNVCFEIFPGAVVIFDDTIENCPIVKGKWEGIEREVYASLFTGHNLDNVSIIGRGKIDGQGEKWWNAHFKNRELRKKYNIKGREPDNPKDSPLKAPRPRLINLYHCTNVLISELTFIDSPAWTIHPVYCENLTVEKISIIQPYESPNTDGINPESCKNVRILNCFVDCGDDCITIKSGYNEDGRRVGKACENIVISNCTFAHGRSAIGIGSEMSGGVKNVAISNCVFNGTLRGLRIKTNRERGGTVENYRADNLVISNVETAISIDMYYGKKDIKKAPVSEKTPHFKNIQISNITATDVVNSALITGLPEANVEDISITNSNFTTKNGFEINFVKNIDLRDVTVNCETGNPLTVNHSEDVEIDNFGTEDVLKDNAVIKLTSVNEIFISNCNVKKGTEVFLKSENISDLELTNNRLRAAKVMK